MANKSFIALFTHHDIYLLFLLIEGKPSKSNKSHYETVSLHRPLWLQLSDWLQLQESTVQAAIIELTCQEGLNEVFIIPAVTGGPSVSSVWSLWKCFFLCPCCIQRSDCLVWYFGRWKQKMDILPSMFDWIRLMNVFLGTVSSSNSQYFYVFFMYLSAKNIPRQLQQHSQVTFGGNVSKYYWLKV